MEPALDIVAKGAVLAFVLASMATAGLGLGARAIVGPLRPARRVTLALVASFVVAPAVAWALAAAFRLAPPHATGLILLGSAAGAPFLPKLAELARGDVAFSVGLMLLLTVGSAVFMPVALPFLTPGLSANPWPVLRPILLTMLLPLAVGMLIRARSPRWATHLRPYFAWASNVGMALTVVLLIGLNGRAMLDTLGSGAVAAALLFVLAMLAIGYVIGGASPASRAVLGLGTAQRNIAAALIVATGNAANPEVAITVLVCTLAGLLVLLPAAAIFGRHKSPTDFEDAHTADHLLPEEVAR